MHTSRYQLYPAQVFLGFGEHLSEKEMQLFTDINKKHRSNVCVIIDKGNDEEILTALGGYSLHRAGGVL